MKDSNKIEAGDTVTIQNINGKVLSVTPRSAHIAWEDGEFTFIDLSSLTLVSKAPESKAEQKKNIIEIMQADEKDGLYGIVPESDKGEVTGFKLVDKIIKDRIDWFENNYHTFEAHKLFLAWSEATSLIPQSHFDSITHKQ